MSVSNKNERLARSYKPRGRKGNINFNETLASVLPSATAIAHNNIFIKQHRKMVPQAIHNLFIRLALIGTSLLNGATKVKGQKNKKSEEKAKKKRWKTGIRTIRRRYFNIGKQQIPFFQSCRYKNALPLPHRIRNPSTNKELLKFV